MSYNKYKQYQTTENSTTYTYLQKKKNFDKITPESGAIVFLINIYKQ